jgi:hypothetical protein
MVPVDDADQARTTEVAPEASAQSPGSPTSVPVPEQLGSASDQGLETSPTVSDHSILTIVITNYWSFSIWPPTKRRIHRNRYRSAQMRMYLLNIVPFVILNYTTANSILSQVSVIASSVH